MQFKFKIEMYSQSSRTQIGNEGGRPLRPSASHGDTSHNEGQSDSPLRSKSRSPTAYVPRSTQEEEELYERRRQEELRRQILQKERELANLSSNKDRLMQRIERSLNSSSSRVPASLQNESIQNRSIGREGEIRNSNLNDSLRQPSNSPLRMQRSGLMTSALQGLATSTNELARLKPDIPKYTPSQPAFQNYSLSNPNFAHTASRELSPPNKHSLDRSMRPSGSRESPLRKKSGSPPSREFQRTAQQQSSTSLRPSTQEYLAQLHTDNASLQRRLNLVLAELDRVSRERSNLNQKLNLAMDDTNHLKKCIDEEERGDKANRELQVDISSTRDNNKFLKHSISEVDRKRTEAIHQLRCVQAERERGVNSSDDLKNDLQRKLALSKDIECDTAFTREQLHKVNQEIQNLERQLLEDKRNSHDIVLCLERLIIERNDLQSKLEQLKRTYDNCVNEISRERASMEAHNRHHTKLLVSKAMFLLLETMFDARKQTAMNEFYSYCRFDENCHSRLKKFVAILDRVGKHKMSQALQKWYHKSFKPCEMFKQKVALCDKFSRQKLLAKFWATWRVKFNQSEDFFDTKGKSCNLIWLWKLKDTRKETLRCFVMWRDQVRTEKHRENKLRLLVREKLLNQTDHAFQKWRHYARNLTQQVRLNILVQEFTHDQVLQTTFSQLRIITSEKRRARHHKLRLYLKAWKDSNRYRKFLMAGEVATTQLIRARNTNILKQCFDALRQNKEEEKVQLMLDALTADCGPAIDVLDRDLARIRAQNDRTDKTRALNTIKRMILAEVASYFVHWRNRQFKVKVGIHDNLRTLLMNAYFTRLETAFSTWQKGKNKKEINMQQGLIQEMTLEGVSLQGEVDNISKDIVKEKQRVDRTGRASLSRGIAICNRRYLKQAIDRWQDLRKTEASQEDMSALIIKKMRRRLCRQAFDIYVLRVKQMRQADKDENRLLHYRELLEARSMRRTFNALCVYRNTHHVAKNYWTILLTKMDLWMKRKAFLNWQSISNTKAEIALSQTQNDQTQVLQGLKQNLGNQSKTQLQKDLANKALQAQLKKMGDRTLANHFARSFYSQCTRGFEKWKEFVARQKHKESILRRTIEHWRKHMYNFTKACMMNWVQKARIRETAATLKHTVMLIEEAKQLNKHKGTLFSEEEIALQQGIAVALAATELNNERLTRTVGMIIYKNDKNYYQSRLRFLFQTWRDHTSRQKHFAASIQKVVLKSLWQRGFQNIREFSNDKKLTRSQNKALQQCRRHFWRHYCGRALNRWRESQYVITIQTTIDTVETEIKVKADHTNLVSKVKNKNCDRAEKIIVKTRTHNYMQGWKNVTRWLKAARVAKRDHKQTFGAYIIRRALKKWLQRKTVTQFARDRATRMKAFQYLLYTKAVFRALKTKYQREKAFCVLLSNIAAKVDTKQIQCGFQMIQEYTNAKRLVYKNQQSHTSKDLVSLLWTLYHKRMTRYYSHLREAVLTEKDKQAKFANVFIHYGDTSSIRRAFERWKKQAKCIETVEEVNQMGPVVEQVLDSQVNFKNILSFMQKEGFTPEEIALAEKKSVDRQKTLMLRAVQRMKHYTTDQDLYLKPKFFDRWRMLIKLRKLVKHWLQFIQNRQKDVSCDLAQFFNRWKYHYADKLGELKRMTKEQLAERCLAATKKLHYISESHAGDTELIDHLLLQREELLDNYQKSQRLGLALCRENMTHALMKGFSRMSFATHDEKRAEHQDAVTKNIDLIAQIKGKISELENDNENLASENEELRQFSLDGYQIAKNVQNLTNEREKLSVDLADKAALIRKLLEENDTLGKRLRNAEQAARNIIAQRSRR